MSNGGPTTEATADAVTATPLAGSNDLSMVADTPAPVTPALAARKASDPKLKEAAAAPGPDLAKDEQPRSKSKCGKCAIL